ncbi:aminoglycoside phosphotransferase family protein [Promicromonospora thailandica]|uniref:Phosphotransferase family enzyme n=1 Tax=Promicromonospora thailandica TaxID=765201 RepID=A0A9X2G4M4_9MICO|nr:aminoglycoside phosphotransferase family protein [Promicromonospora thailandica]MCP2263184.1 hypothetical protein [Promicromonospora thailandica]BFF18570.1 hypothetical protein GCM10025730_20910 [Promicromonospora thailandica]
MTRVRPTWPDLPAHVRKAVVARLGGPVTSWTSHDGGFSPGWALTLESPAGRAFVKVASTDHAEAARLHRAEAVRSAALPDGVPAPAFRWAEEVADPGEAEPSWVLVASDVVDGRAPRGEPWDLGDLDRLQRLARRIAEHEVPAGGAFPDAADLSWPEAALLADQRPAGLATYDPWLAAHVDVLAEVASAARQREALAGPHLVHNDLRADNALVVRSPDGGEEAVAVDWPHARRGPAFVDQVAMLPVVRATGGPAPQEVLERTPLPAGTDAEAVTVWVAVLTAYFVRSSLLEAPPGIPHLRAFQRIQAEACIPWLRSRLG